MGDLQQRFRSPGQPLDLAEVAREATEQARLRSFGADVSLHLGQGTRVLGDADSLVGALRNLVENALAAARSGGHVKIAVRTVDTEAEARVTDDGPGIPEADRERIFERFVRLDGAGSGGTGLGLAIARRTARRHGGDVTCDAVNRGASFTMRLPLYSPTSGPSSTA